MAYEGLSGLGLILLPPNAPDNAGQRHLRAIGAKILQGHERRGGRAGAIRCMKVDLGYTTDEICVVAKGRGAAGEPGGGALFGAGPMIDNNYQ
jgi:hypothetical protein